MVGLTYTSICALHNLFVSATVPPCEEGGVRLVGGADGYSGRVEVCVGGVWGTVCADGFTPDLAATVCRDSEAAGKGVCVCVCVHDVSVCVVHTCMHAVYTVCTRHVSMCVANDTMVPNVILRDRGQTEIRLLHSCRR